jgi:hypothetical protein
MVFNLLAAIAALSGPAWCCAQAALGGGNGPPTAAGIIEKAGLYVIEDGKLVPYPGLTVQQLDELLATRTGAMQPLYNLERMTVSGQVHDDYAHLTVDFEAAVFTSAWVRIPLRLAECVLKAELPEQGEGVQFLRVEESGGFAWYLKDAQASSTQPQQHRLTLHVLVELEKLAGHTRMRFTAPLASRSELKLEVPVSRATATVLGGRLVEDPLHGDGTTRFTVQGIAGSFELAWRPESQPVVTSGGGMEVAGVVVCRIDATRGVVLSEARLSIAGLGTENQLLHVRLPPGAQLDGEDPRVREVQPASSDLTRGALVEVRHNRMAGPLVLRTRRQLEGLDAARGATPPLELGGFQVQEALAQSGYWALQLIGDWRLSYDSGTLENLQRIDPQEPGGVPDEVRRGDYLAVFRYWRQPVSMRVRILRPDLQVRVDALHRVELQDDQSVLHTELHYRVRGGKLFEVQLDVAPWNIDALEPADLIDSDRILWQQQPLVIPLKQPQADNFRLVLRGHRPHDPAAGPVRIPLPRPADTTQHIVELRTDTNVSLRSQPVLKDLRLPAAAVEGALAPPAGVLRYQGEGPQPEIAAEIAVHQRRTVVRSTTRVALTPQQAEVQQTLVYQVDYVPLGVATLQLPRGQTAADSLVYLLDGQKVQPLVLDGGAAADAPSVQVLLPFPGGPRIGVFELQIQYRPVPIQWTAPQPQTLQLPLAIPADAELHVHRATVTAEGDIAWQPADPQWRELVVPAAGGRSHRPLEASGAVAMLPLSVQLPARNAASGAHVEQAWIQTWYTAAQRQDRAVFRFSTPRTEVTLVLPDGVSVLSRVRLDGQNVIPRLISPGRLSIALPGGGSSAPHVLDVEYRVAQGVRGWTNVAAVAHLADADWVRHTYWQLVVPEEWYLTGLPPDFHSESPWRWQGWYWARQPVVDQGTLEAQLGAPAAAAPSSDAHVYLLSTPAAATRIEFAVAHRTWLVGAASALALALGWLLIYVPVLRHAAALLAAGVAVAAVALAAPGTALLVAQASLLGAGCVVCCAVLHAWLNRQRGATVRISTGASSIVERGSTQPALHRSSLTGDSSTMTSMAASGAAPKP